MRNARRIYHVISESVQAGGLSSSDASRIRVPTATVTFDESQGTNTVIDQPAPSTNRYGVMLIIRYTRPPPRDMPTTFLCV